VYNYPAVELTVPPSACISAPPFLLTGGTPSGGTYSGFGVDPATGLFDPSAGAGAHLIRYHYTDGNGCAGADSAVLTVHLLPVTGLGPLAAVCVSASPYPLTGGTPAGGSWSGIGVIQGTGFFDPSSGPGIHHITYHYTDQHGCSDSALNTLFVNQLPNVQLSDFLPVCASANPFILSGGLPSGGVFSGNGVNSMTGVFDPSSGVGPHQVTYTFTDANGCSNSQMKTLTVNPLPVVSLVLEPVCITAPPFLLTGGTPSGGAYSGTGVNAITGVFDPASGAGPHTITYSYTDASGCVNSTTAQINVIPVPIPSGIISVPAAVCEGDMHVVCSVTGGDPLATSFLWEINPAPAGIITGTEATIYLSLNPGFTGTAGIRFRPVSNCGTGYYSAYTNIAVKPKPQVSFSSCFDSVTTKGAKPFVVKGGLPVGGQYSIDGMTLPDGMVDPGSLSISPPDHQITYTYTNSYSCMAEKVKTLTVLNSAVFNCKNNFTDPRDQKQYPTFTVISGTHVRCWMASNLNYGVRTDQHFVMTDNCVPEKYCKQNQESQCDAFGGIYQWDEMMDYLPVQNAIAEGKKGICPPQWHVATAAEWEEMISYFEGAGIAGWRLTDLFLQNGFHGLLPGILYQNSNWDYSPPGFSASLFWTSTIAPAGERVFSHGVNKYNPSVSTYHSARNNAFQVRCVMDE